MTYQQQFQGGDFRGTPGLLIEPSGGNPNKPVAFSELGDRILEIYDRTHRIFILTDGTLAYLPDGTIETTFWIDLTDSNDYAVTRIGVAGQPGESIEDASKPRIEYTTTGSLGQSGYFLKFQFYGDEQFPDNIAEIYITRFYRSVPSSTELQPSASSSAALFSDPIAATADLSASRIVARTNSGLVYASCDDLSLAQRVLGILPNSAATGVMAQAITSGLYQDPAWNWNTEAGLYLSADGFLTQAPSLEAEFLLQVARPVTSSIVLVEPQQVLYL